MPTYCYRCQSCQQEQNLSHGMLETMMPVCEACGHFCHKVIQSVPAILSATPAIEPREPIEQTPAHHCGSSCVLHRSAKPKNPNTEGVS